jgi:nucleoside-diphosphate-sugar epimerase
VDWVFHFGGLISARNRDEFFAVNAAGTKNLYRAFLEAGAEPPAPDGAGAQERHSRLFMLCSSLAAVGPGGDGEMLDETATPRPVTAYGASKRAGEIALHNGGGHQSENWDLPVRRIIVRPPAVYGPRDAGILKMFRWIRRGWIPLPAPQNARFGVIHVDDLASGTVLLAEKELSGIYHLSDGESYSWRDLGGKIASLLGVKARPLPIPRWISTAAALGSEIWGRLRRRPPLVSRDKLRELRGTSWVCSIQKARRDAGYRPRMTIGEGLKTTVEWYRDSGWL